ncbi:hypothetical protein M440DRAFT_1395588 [Trichoderma longibrachiatum ATCC 18648]|uniref:Uncharacterized protein n=1 Tax=Trichoderma longibrachiatum ATCC 18648 TaxID=983965 RepID=A0A2T4BQ36_TRILO|nr:hypothetical protein M440DRAFT_1395588 [Trichoderma longibrachiatum ATCC 18648]
MALVLGLVAAAAKAISNNDDRHHNNSNYSGSRNDLCCNSSPYAAYSPQITGSRRAERRMERKMRKEERKARNTDMLLSLMGGSRGASGSTGLSGGSTTGITHHQPVHGSGGVPYVGYNDNSRGRDVYPESQREHQWRNDDDFESRERTGSSSEALPTYEQAVRRSDKSRR